MSEEEKKSLNEFFKRQINDSLKVNSMQTKNHTFENWKNNFETTTKNSLETYCRKFKKEIFGDGILLYGPSGTGKTYAIDCVYNSLKNDYIILRTNLSKILEVLKEGFDNNYSINRFYKEIKMLDLLIIDDLGSEKKTEWNTEILFNIINICYENNISLAITTNLRGKELSQYLDFNGSDKMLSRLKNTCKAFELENKIRKEKGKW